MDEAHSNGSKRGTGLPRGWLAAIALVAIIALIASRRSSHRADRENGKSATTNPVPSEAVAERREDPSANRQTYSPRQTATSKATPEQIVARKVAQFGRNRRALVRAIAKRSHLEIPAEVEQFFDALEAGNWDQIKSRWHEMAVHSGQYDYSSKDSWEHINPFWAAVLDAYGVAEQAHDWPAQQLLDYGNSVLGSLRPGMVYVGGTDPGRWIPELLNETGDGEHIIVTQNAFADSRYADFVNTQYSDRMKTLTSEDSQRAFQEYTAEAQKRLEHDQQFPDEPKQVRPGEDIRVVDGRIMVSGQTAVMAINEKLLETLIKNNPEMSFAVEESFPMSGTYSNALPLGPLMELNAKSEQQPFTPERATQDVDYWRDATARIMSDFDTTASENALKSYSHDAVAAANLLASNDFNSQAEETYRMATKLWPANSEATICLANLLASTGREADARQLLDDFAKNYPDQRKNLEYASKGMKIVWSLPSK
jgi:hypothetical protein